MMPGISFNTGFEGLLGVIPCTTCVVLENRPQDAAHGHTGHVSTQCFSAHAESNNDWSDDCDGTGQHHFTQSRLGGNVHALAVLGRARAFHDAGNLFELTAYFFYHFHGCLAHAIHG